MSWKHKVVHFNREKPMSNELGQKSHHKDMPTTYDRDKDQIWTKSIFIEAGVKGKM